MPDFTRPNVVISVLGDDGAAVPVPSELVADRLLSLSFQDSDNKADRVVLKLDNGDLRFFEEGDDVLGGTMLEVSWGYPGAMSPPRRTVVKKITGGIVLSVEAYAVSVQMHRKVNSRRFVGMTRSQVVEDIAELNGYEYLFRKVDKTEDVFEVITQAAETDAAFLTRLAARERFIFYVDDTGLHWHKRGFDSAPTHILEWRGDTGGILNFNIESDLVRRVARVVVKGRDPILKKDFEAIATSESTERVTLGEVVEVVDPETLESQLQRRNSTEILRATSASKASRGAQEANARFRSAERKTVKISMALVGDPTIRAKTIVEIRGLTAMFNGLYYVKEAVHQITGTSGYTTSVRLVRDAKGALARTIARTQSGDRNRQEAKKPGEVVMVEIVNPERPQDDGRIEFRRSGKVVGSEDPEVGISLPRGQK